MPSPASAPVAVVWSGGAAMTQDAVPGVREDG